MADPLPIDPLLKYPPERIPAGWMARFAALPEVQRGPFLVLCSLEWQRLGRPDGQDAAIVEKAYGTITIEQRIQAEQDEKRRRETLEKRKAEREAAKHRRIERQLAHEKADAHAPTLEVIQWVANRLDIEGVMPDEAPSPVAYSLWKMASSDPEWFFKNVWIKTQVDEKELAEQGKRKARSVRTLEELDRVLEGVLDVQAAEADGVEAGRGVVDDGRDSGRVVESV